MYVRMDLLKVRTISRSAKASTDDVTSSQRIRVGSRNRALYTYMHHDCDNHMCFSVMTT